MMRTGGSAKLLGFCCRRLGGWWGALLWLWAGGKHAEADTRWARVNVNEENQIFVFISGS